MNRQEPETWTKADSEYAEAFARTAREFCSFLDDHKALDHHTFLRKCHRFVSRLHEQALGLPEAFEFSDGNPSAGVSERAGVLYKEIAERLGTRDAFWVVFNPFEKEEPVASSISDGLRDIYLDLKDGLAAFDAGSLQDAVWSWKFNHQSHWGKHAVETMMALQDLAGSDEHVE